MYGKLKRICRLKRTEEVIETIANIEEEKLTYNGKFDIFYERFCKWDKGTASEQVVKKVLK
ncbi:CDP-glycerol glycerophosphotransferase family protein [Neobacillus vireti]|uniref:CDP-glycerol glycerophosphotransferase family protein n=1 Tax=Neobacillus vireti TaxID=220686 RepID=UPI00128AEFBA